MIPEILGNLSLPCVGLTNSQVIINEEVSNFSELTSHNVSNILGKTDLYTMCKHSVVEMPY